jgi:uncharacterized protein (TIGR01244 family)
MRFDGSKYNIKINILIIRSTDFMATPVNPITSDFSVAPQLGPDDMEAVAKLGYKSVIINRADQPTAQSVSDAARAAGLRVEYQPVISGQMTTDDVARFAELLQTMPAPILAYCRSGARCTALYQSATAAG